MDFAYWRSCLGKSHQSTGLHRPVSLIQIKKFNINILTGNETVQQPSLGHGFVHVRGHSKMWLAAAAASAAI